LNQLFELNMFPLLLKIIPLDLAATLSPGILALALVLLGSQFRPRLRTFALFLGTLLTAIILALLGLSLGQAAPSEIHPTLVSAIIDLLLGAFFVFFGIRTLLSKERQTQSGENQKPQLIKWFIIGLIISITNFDAVFLLFTASKEVGGSGVSQIDKFILLLVNILFFTLPSLLPLVFYLITPSFAAKILTKVNQFVLKYSKYLIFIVFVIFGIYFLYRGLNYF